MFDEQDRKYFYDEFKNNGYEVGSYDDFKKDLNNKEDRDWYYNEAKNMGYDVGTQADFDKMVLDATPSTPAPTKQKQEAATPSAKQETATSQNTVKPQQPSSDDGLSFNLLHIKHRNPQTGKWEEESLGDAAKDFGNDFVKELNAAPGKLISAVFGTSNDKEAQLQVTEQQPAQAEAQQQPSEAELQQQAQHDAQVDEKLTKYMQDWKNRPDQEGTYFQNMVEDLEAEGANPEEAIQTTQKALNRYANRSATGVINKVVSSLVDGTTDKAEENIAQQWYSHPVQDELKKEADTMGISYDDYVAKFLKPIMVQSLVQKYGQNYRKTAEDIATRLYSHDEDVQNRLLNQDINSALTDVIGKYVDPSVVEEYNKAQEAGSKAFAEGMEGSQYMPAGSRIGMAMVAQHDANQAKDPQKILGNLKQKFNKLYEDPQFLTDIANATFKVMQGYGMNGGQSGDPKQFKPMIEAVLKNQLDQLEVSKMMPKGSAEYIMKTGLGNTIIGKMTRKAMQTNYQNWLEDIANQQYQPGFWERIGSGALTFAGDAWSYWLPGAAGGKLTKSMIAKAEGRLAEDLMAKGMETKMAERAAKVLIGKSKTMTLKTGAAHGAVTFGGQSAISTPVDEEYRRGQYDENGNIYNPSILEEAAKTAKNVVGQSAIGAVMQGGTIANMIGKGRGLATNILADVGGKLTDASIMTGQQMVERMAQDPSFKPTGKDLAESILENTVSLTSIGLPGMVGKYARFKDAREFNRKYDFTNQDIAELNKMGYADLRNAFEKMGIGEYAVTGENAQRLDGQLTEKYMTMLKDNRVPETLKAKMMAVVEGKRPSSLSPVIDSDIVAADDGSGKYYVETLNIDGGVVDRQEFSSYKDAQKADKKLDYEKSLGLASVLENEFHNEYTKDRLDRLYEQAAEKYNMGEPLTDEEKTAVYLHQNADAVKDIVAKQQKGVILTEEEQTTLDAYRTQCKSALENSSAMREFVSTFEDSHDVAHGTLRKALESRDKKYKPLVESYLKELHDAIERKREMEQTKAELHDTLPGEVQKMIEQSVPEETSGTEAPAEGTESPAEGEEVTETPAGTNSVPTPHQLRTNSEQPSTQKKVEESDAYVMGQTAYKNGDTEGLKAISHNADVAELRLQRAFDGDESKVVTIYQAIEGGEDIETFVQHANDYTPAQQEAVRKYAEAMNAKKGVEDAVNHADDGYAEAMTEQLWPYATEDGNIVPVKLTNGKTAFLKKSNEYGGAYVTVTGDDGKPVIKQASSVQIKEKGEPIPFQDYVNQLVEQKRAATMQGINALFDGSDMKQGDMIDLAMEQGMDNMQMQFAGYTGDGKIVLTDGKEQIALTKEEFDTMRNNALRNTINAQLDAEAEEQAKAEAAKAEAEKQEKYKNGIFGYAAGQPDYSDQQTDPKVAAEYLQETSGENRKALFSNIEAERKALQTRISQLKSHIATNEDWLSTNADLDQKNAESRTLANKQMQGQIADLQARLDKWNKIRTAAMTPEEAKAFKEERKAEVEKAGIDESAIMPTEEREVAVLTDKDLKKQYPTMDEASDYIASQRKALYHTQEDVQREIDGVNDMLDQYTNGEIELAPEQIKELNTTKAQLQARQDNLTLSAKELKAQDKKLDKLYQAEEKAKRDAEFAKMTPAEQRKVLVAEAIKNNDLKAIKEIYKDSSVEVTDLTPQTIEEAVSAALRPHSLSAESLQQELGKGNFTYGIGKGYDSNKFNYLLAKKGTGMTVTDFAVKVYNDLPDNLRDLGYTDQDVRNTLLDMFKTYDNVKEMMNVPVMNRIAAAEAEFAGEEKLYEAQKEGDNIEPVGVGPFGNIYNQFVGKPSEAIDFLIKQQGGEALGALHHKSVGDIDLVWGKAGTKHSDGFGLAKLVKYHPEVVEHLQDILNSMSVDKVSPNRVNLSSDKYKAGIRLDYDGKSKTWLLTAYEKEEPSDSSKTTDTATTSLRGDTALSQSDSPSSADKGTNISDNSQEKGEENAENLPFEAKMNLEDLPFHRDSKEVKLSEMTEPQKIAYKAVSTMLKKAGIPVKVVSNEEMERVAEAQDNLVVSRLLGDSHLRFNIKTPEQKKAANAAYDWAIENRPDKHKQYAVVNMDKPNEMPEYFEKKELAERARKYYSNDWKVGNYKAFDLDKPFEEQVKNVKGNVPDEFDPYKKDAAQEKKNAIQKQLAEAEKQLDAIYEMRKNRQKQLLQQYMDENLLSSTSDVPDKALAEIRLAAVKEYRPAVQELLDRCESLNNQLQTMEAAETVRLSTSKGIVYGYTDGKEIVMNQQHLNPNTPIHEYHHLWRTAAKMKNPGLIEHGDKLIKETEWFKNLRNDPNYKHLSEEQLCDEAFSRLTGEDGEAILEQMAKDAIKENPLDTAKELSVINRLKNWLRKFWYWTLDTFTNWKPEDIKKMTLEDIRNLVLRDLANGVDPRKILKERNAETRYSLKDAKEDRIQKLRESKPIEITGNEIPPSDDLKQYKKNAKEYGKTLQGTYTNEDTGVKVQLQRGRKNGGVNEVLQHDYKDIPHLQSVAAIPQIIRKSIYIGSEENTDKEKNPAVSEYQYYVCGLKIGGVDYTVRSVFAMDNNGNRYYDHKLTDIEKGKLLDLIDQGVNDSSFDATSSTELTTANNSVGKDKKLLHILQTNRQESAEKFSLKDDKTLVGVHNITEDKLRKALKLGGFANPSVAIIDTGKSAHNSFGEISFIAPSALVDKKTGGTAGTWTTDAYTQRYPSVERQMSDKGYRKFVDWVDSLDFTDSEKAEIKRQAKDALESNGEPAWELMYLREKGIDIKGYNSKVDYLWQNIIEEHPSAEDILESMKSDPKLNNDVTGLAKSEIISPIWRNISQEVRAQVSEEEGRIVSVISPKVRAKVKEIFERDYAPKLLNKDGSPKKSDVKKVVSQIVQQYEDTKTFSFQKSKVKASSYVHNNGLYTDYLRWQENKLDEFGTTNRLFRGYNNDGTRKYIPETLENVSKAMKSDADGQTNGSEYTSFGSFIAKVADRVDSTDEMRANKDKLASNEDKQNFYEKWEEVYYDLAKSLYNDVSYGEERLHDIVTKSDPKKYAKKEYGITLTAGFMKKLDALKKAVRNELKSNYFETKFERPVHLNEFAAAVVPNNLGADVRKSLEDSGLRLYDYDANKEGDRQRAFDEAVNSNDNIRFSIGGVRGAANLDKAEEVTTRLDNLNVARQMEGAKKDAKTIKVATGWERGADGKWRYEMPDAKMKDTIDIGGKIVKRSEDDMLWTGGKLGEYVDAPDLFKAYPQLKDVRLDTDEIVNDMPSNGAYDPNTNTITIHATEVKFLNSILNHEIQHAIQYIEGFATGGNEEMFLDKERIAKMEQRKAEIEQEIANGNYENEEELQEVETELFDLTEDSPYHQYRSLAGEVEARNVQKRLGMTDEERRNSLAAETEDVAREDQIFLFDEGGENHMGSRTNKNMAKIGKYFDGRNMSDSNQVIVDVFSGKRDKQTVAFTDKDGHKHHMFFFQGHELKAGSKHAIYRHYGEKEGWFNEEEITKVHDALILGNRFEDNGMIEYTYKDKSNGIEYTVAAEKDGTKERFITFYTNRKAPKSSLQNTQQGAQADVDAFQGAKVSNSSETTKENAEKFSLKDAKEDRIQKLRESKPVEISGKEITPSDDLKQYKKNALEFGKTLRGTYTNEDTGEVIDLTGGNKRGGIRELLQHDYKDIEHLQSIAAIPQIIQKSVFIDELPNEDKQHYPDVKSFRYYVCGLKIDSKDYTVKAVVAEQNNGNRYYDHRLTDIEKGKLLSIIPTIQKAGIDGNLPDSVYKDKRLISILQTNRQKIVEEVKNTANQLGGAEVTTYTNASEVPEEYKEAVNKGAKGWYDPSTHTVHVYLPNCADANEAQRTVFHEKIGHEGMEILLGGEEGLRKFANFVYRSVGKAIRSKILDFANKYDPDWKNPDRMNVGAQEYMAHLAEEGPKTAEDFSLWTKIKHYLIKALKKLGIRIPGLLNDKDLRYYLMKAGKSLHTWDEMPKEKQEAMMQQATNADIKNALGDMKGKPRQKKGESAIQFMKRMAEWKKWQKAHEDKEDPEPPMFYDFDKDEAGKKEWEKLNKDWRDRHGLEGEEPTSMPTRKEGETDDEYMTRIHNYEKWQNACKDKADPMPDMFAFEKEKQAAVKEQYENWLTRHELNEESNADLDLYEGKIYPAETNPEADEADRQFMQDLADVTSTDVSSEGAARSVKYATIRRRKNMEEASADDAIYINEVKRNIEEIANGGLLDNLLSEYKGTSSKAEKLAEAIPYIIEAPRRIREIAYKLNSTGVFGEGHIHITPDDVEAIQELRPELAKLAAKKHTEIKNGEEVELFDDMQGTTEMASKMANIINSNHSNEPGFVPIDGTDILNKNVLPVILKPITPWGVDYKELSEPLKSVIDAIRDWYNYTFDWLKDNNTLKADTGFTVDYVNHLWDKEKSDAKAYSEFVENRQRTKSPNEKPREINTLMEGIEAGLVPKTTDITKMMAYYSRSNIEAWANKTMLQEVSGLTVVERDDKGDIISSNPVLSSEPPLNLEQYDYYEIPGVGPVWVYSVSPKQVKVKNPITSKDKVLYSEASAGSRFGVVFDTYQSAPFWKGFDTLASSAKKLELGFSGFHAGALTEVYMVQNMIEFGPKKALGYFLKYIMGDTMKNHRLPCFANPEDFQEAAAHLVKFGATNDYAAADVQDMYDNFRNAMQGIEKRLRGNLAQKAVGTATLPLKIASEFAALANKGMDVALWDFLHDGLKLATYRLRSERTKRRAAKEGWTQTQLDMALDEDGQFVNDMFGGQHWDVLGASTKTLRRAGRALLSPDWNISTTRHFLAVTGFGSIWNEATAKDFKNYYEHVWSAARGKSKMTPDDWGRLSRQKSAILCYGLGFMVFYEALANAANAAFRAIDEEKERKKAEEIRKTNPDYKSPYELAYPDGMKWYDYLMRGNTLGQQSKIFVGRYADGTEMYIRHGKQFREVPEYLFNSKGELEFPGPMVQRMQGKANPMVRMMLDNINYLSDFQASHADQELQRKYGKTIGLLYKDALYWAPFLIPSQENKEFKAVDFFFPSSKGFSSWKAQDYFKNFILSGDMEGVMKTYQSCQRNGIDAEKQLQAAITSIKALESQEMQDGVTSLQVATQRFDEAKSVTEKRKMREKMRKFLSLGEYKAFTMQQATDMVKAFQEGEDVKEMKKADDKYLGVATSADVTEDWRIQQVRASTKTYADKLSELKGENKAKAGAFKNAHARVFKARKAITQATTKMNKLKKKLGDGNDKATLNQIRDIRKKLLKELAGMEHLKKYEE
jgi:hypothetical protein